MDIIYTYNEKTGVVESVKSQITMKGTKPNVVQLAKDLVEKLKVLTAEEFVDKHLAEVDKYDLIPKTKIEWLFKEAMRKAGYNE
jgi:hypothetical protein